MGYNSAHSKNRLISRPSFRFTTQQVRRHPMGDLRKPQFSKKRRFFFHTFTYRKNGFLRDIRLNPLVCRHHQYSSGPRASSLYLPLIMKPPICDPAMTLTSGDTQVLFGTPGDDHICEYGFGGNITQYAEGSAGNDSIYQDCRGVYYLRPDGYI